MADLLLTPKHNTFIHSKLLAHVHAQETKLKTPEHAGVNPYT